MMFAVAPWVAHQADQASNAIAPARLRPDGLFRLIQALVPSSGADELASDPGKAGGTG